MALALKIKEGKFDRIPRGYSDELQRTIEWMLQMQKDQRANIDSLRQHPMIAMRLSERRPKQVPDQEKSFDDRKKAHFQVLARKEQELKQREDALRNHEE